jgi:hypothetical protein
LDTLIATTPNEISASRTARAPSECMSPPISIIHSCYKHRIGAALPYGEGHSQ